MKRIFIAVRIIPEQKLLEVFSSFKNMLAKDSVKWTEISNIHLTLEFLGDTDDDKITVLSAMLKEKCSSFAHFSFNLKGSGIFKSIRDPRTIWMGVDLSERLQDLKKNIQTGLADAGFKTGDKPFSPHLTLGRIRYLRTPDSLMKVLEMYKDTFIQTVGVNEVILYQSILKPSGPLYIPLGIFPLTHPSLSTQFLQYKE